MELTRNSLIERQMALVQHYLDRLDDLRHMFAQGREWAQEALLRFDQDWQQFQAQQQWAVRAANRDQRVAVLVVAFPQRAQSLLMQLGVTDALVWLNDAVTWGDQTDLRMLYGLHRIAYDIHILGQNIEQMALTLECMKDLAEKIGDKDLLTTNAILTSRYYDEIDDRDNLLVWAEQAMVMSQDAVSPITKADAQSQLATACTRIYKYSRARDALMVALPIYQAHNLRLKEAGIYATLGMNAFYASDYATAVAYGEQAVAIDRELGDRPRELIDFANLSLMILHTYDFQKALLYGQQAWTAARGSGYQQAAFTSLVTILLAYTRLGLYENLAAALEQAETYQRERPTDYLASFMEYIRSESAYEQEDWNTACRLAEPAALKDRSRNDLEREYEANFIWGSSLIKLERWDKAAVVFRRGIELYDAEAENPSGWSGSIAGLSLVEARRGQSTEAARLLETFVQLISDKKLVNVFDATKSILFAYDAALLLDSPLQVVIREAAQAYLQHLLHFVTDEASRAALCARYSIRQLMALS